MSDPLRQPSDKGVALWRLAAGGWRLAALATYPFERDQADG
jgi:hypothetical protein